MSNVDISDHTLLIDGTNPINTDLNRVIAHNTKEIELYDSRNIDQPCNFHIYNTNFI